MKRTNCVLDEQLLEGAMSMLGAQTYSDAINQALAEVIRVRKVQRMPEFFGQNLWEGDLAEMREDDTRPAGKATAR